MKFSKDVLLRNVLSKKLFERTNIK